VAGIRFDGSRDDYLPDFTAVPAELGGTAAIFNPQEPPLKSIWSFVYMAKIYVGNLPFTATDEEIRTLFAAHGTVESVALPIDRDTGRPRGFGFVEMSQADASRAIQNLNGTDMGGRSLKVNEAQDKPRSGGGGGGRSGGGGFRSGGGDARY
jgi:RNA recognition motif-containing protein